LHCSGQNIYKINIALLLAPSGAILSITVLSHTGQALLYRLIIYKYLITLGSFISVLKKNQSFS